MQLIHHFSQSQPRTKGYLLLFFLCIISFLPGSMTMPPQDRDEPRFAQATKQMLQTGDFISIRFRDEARNKKPVGIYWLQAVSVKMGEILGVPDAYEQIWLYRLPSLFAAFACVFLTTWIGSILMAGLPYGWLAGLGAGAALALTPLLNAEAHLAKTDAVLLALILGCIAPLAILWQRTQGYIEASSIKPWGLFYAFWISLSAGFLVKGPVVMIVPLFIMLVLSWRLKTIRWLAPLYPQFGVPLFLLLVAPWFIMIMLKTQGAFLTESLGQDMLNKVAGGVESHGALPGFLFVISLLTLWPLSFVCLMLAPRIWAQRMEPVLYFLLAWLVPAWILQELIPTKLPHYILPLVPALALIISYICLSGTNLFAKTWQKILGTFIPLLVIIFFGAAYGLSFWSHLNLGLQFYIISILALPVSIWMLIQIWQSEGINLDKLIYGWITLALCISTTIFTGFFGSPLANAFFLSPQMIHTIARVQQEESCNPTPILVGYAEPSLVFLSKMPVIFSTIETVAQDLASQPCGIAFINAAQEDRFTQSAQATNMSLKKVDTLKGLNLNKKGYFTFHAFIHKKEI